MLQIFQIKEENVSCVKNELFNQGSKGSWDAFEADDPFNFSNEICHPNEGCYDFKNIDSESIMTYAENLPESTGENKMIHYTPETGKNSVQIVLWFIITSDFQLFIIFNCSDRF